MSRDVLVKVNLEFEKENKEEIYKILEKKEWKGNLTLENEAWVELEFYYEIFEENVEELKLYCEVINIYEYEYIEGEGLYWENEDDDLQRLIKKKILKEKNKTNGN